MTYSLIFSPMAKRQLKKLHKDSQLEAISFIEHLSENPKPENCTKMQGEENIYRIKLSLNQVPYRVVYEILNSDLIIHILKIDQRKNIYRKF